MSLPTVSREFYLMTIVLSDTRERTKISAFDEVEVLFADWWGLTTDIYESFVYTS